MTSESNISPNAGRSLEARRNLRDEFFTQSFDIPLLLESLEAATGIVYFIKDASGRAMVNSRGALRQIGTGADETVGKSPQEYLPADLADKYAADDQYVLRTGKPLRNLVEMALTEGGVRDWVITDKFPLQDQQGKVIGLIGTIQSFEERRKRHGPIGPVGQVVDYINDHLSQPIQMKQIAAVVGLSERHLQRLFQRVFGMTIGRFITQTRIHSSIRELVQTDRPLSEIALELGFTDQSAFTNNFKRATGVPPGEYRKRYRSNFGR